MFVRFAVRRKPVSQNAAYIRAGWNSKRGAGGGKGLILSEAGREYKDAVRAMALVAARRIDWPRPELVLRAAVHVTTYNCRHDVDAPLKLTQDALETVLYTNDRVVEYVTARKASDIHGRRVEILVEALEVYGATS